MSPKLSKLEKSELTPRLIVISAPSGAGKTTLCEMLFKEFPQIVPSVSVTTRKKRPNEKTGIHYHFVTPHQFLEQQKKGEFVESAEVHSHWYGTPRSAIEKAIQSQKHVLFNIDVQGAMNLVKVYQKRVLLIFIRPPSVQELEKRLRKRQEDSLTSIEMRLQNAYNELEWGKTFDYQITNDNLEQAYQQLRDIIRKECF